MTGAEVPGMGFLIRSADMGLEDRREWRSPPYSQWRTEKTRSRLPLHRAERRLQQQLDSGLWCPAASFMGTRQVSL